MASAEKGASGLFSGAAGTVACGFSSQKIGRDDVIWLFTALIWPSGTDSPNSGCWILQQIRPEGAGTAPWLCHELRPGCLATETGRRSGEA